MTRFTIRAVFDINCPWCYIGHTRLHRAITAQTTKHPNDAFAIQLAPFYLKPPPQLANPSVPAFPVSTQSRKKLREETYGPLHAEQVLSNIKAAARQDCLPLKYDGPTGTTRNGHRLVYHAGKVRGEQAALETLDALFKAYHEREEDIASLEVLTRIGVEMELGKEEDVKEYLLSGADGDLIDGLVRKAHSMLGGGVPRWSVSTEGNATVVERSGALEVDAWEELFDRMR